MIPETCCNFSFHIQHKGFSISHSHKGVYEFIFITNGEILHKINEKTEVLHKNTLCFLTQTDTHSLQKLTDDSIYISLSIAKNHFEKLLDWIAPDLKSRTFNTYEKINISLDHALEIMDMTNKILISSSEEYYEFLHLLTCFLVREMLTYYHGQAIAQTYCAAVTKFIKLLDTEPNLSAPLDKLVGETGYSYTHLNKLFLQDTGMSVGKYFNRKKLEYAITKIKCSDMSLQDISEILGFSTYSHFSAYFKKCTGISPLQYRKTSADRPLATGGGNN